MKKYRVDWRAWGIEEGYDIVEAKSKAEVKRIVKSWYPKEEYGEEIRVTFPSIEEVK